LDVVKLSDNVKEMPDKLESVVIENGTNFSLGLRQCFCIARALLSNTKIIVLDKNTAAIDLHTDLSILHAFREAFFEFTVLNITQHMNTIFECDRVFVIDDGNI